jgi:hypothetical protein
VHPDGDVVERDLSATSLPPITDDWSATYTNVEPVDPAAASGKTKQPFDAIVHRLK